MEGLILQRLWFQVNQGILKKVGKLIKFIQFYQDIFFVCTIGCCLFWRRGDDELHWCSFACRHRELHAGRPGRPSRCLIYAQQTVGGGNTRGLACLHLAVGNCTASATVYSCILC